MKSEERAYIYILKGLAIFSVVCAHTAPTVADATLSAQVFSSLLNYIGTMGVPVFFLISGYLFDKNTRSFKDFWKKKLFSIVIPWLFCETLLWLYIVLRKGGIGIKHWILFIAGYQHSTYYLSVLLVLYLLFWILKREWQIYVMMILSLFSIISTGWSIGIYRLNEFLGTFYLNFLNWLVFFAIGLILSRKDEMELFRTIATKKAVFVCSMLISGCYFAISFVLDADIWYFSRYSLIAHSANILMIFGLANLIANMKNDSGLRMICEIGKYSFSIYLLHQFLAGGVVAITNKIGLAGLILIRPFVVIGGVMMGIIILKRICGEKKRVYILLGMR